MSDENKSINITFDAETEELLKDAASLSGMSLEQFCLAAARAKADLTVLLYGEKTRGHQRNSQMGERPLVAHTRTARVGQRP